MPRRATQDRWVMVESSDKTWSTGEGNGKPFQYSCLENPMKSMKRQEDKTLKDELSPPTYPQLSKAALPSGGAKECSHQPVVFRSWSINTLAPTPLSWDNSEAYASHHFPKFPHRIKL